MLTRTQAEQRQSLIDTKTEDIAYTSNVSTARVVAIHERGPWMQTRKMKEAQEYEARELLASSALVLELFPATEVQGSPHDESIDIALKNVFLLHASFSLAFHAVSTHVGGSPSFLPPLPATPVVGHLHDT